MELDTKKTCLSWSISVGGWLICAGLCLGLTIALEYYPVAYDIFFPAIIIILFGNIFIFIFVSGRWGANTKNLLFSTLRICIGEFLILTLFYLIGKYAINS